MMKRFRYIFLMATWVCAMAVAMTSCKTSNAEKLNGIWEGPEMRVAQDGVHKLTALVFAFDSENSSFALIQRDELTSGVTVAKGWTYIEGLYHVDKDKIYFTFKMDTFESHFVVRDNSFSEEQKTEAARRFENGIRKEYLSRTSKKMVLDIKEIESEKKLVFKDFENGDQIFTYVGDFASLPRLKASLPETLTD